MTALKYSGAATIGGLVIYILCALFPVLPECQAMIKFRLDHFKTIPLE